MKGIFVCLWAVLIAIVALGGIVQAQDSGARALLSEDLVNTAVASQLPPILAKFNGYTLPDLSGENSEGPLNIHWTLTNIVISSPTVGQVGTAFNSPNSIAVAATGIGIIINADRSYYFWTGWKNSDHGSVQLSFSSVSVGVEVAVGEAYGKAQLSLVQDGLDLGDCSISLSGGASWLYDLFKSVIVDEIKSGASNAFDSGVPQVIAEANAKLAEQSMYITVPKETFVAINYELTEQPTVPATGFFTLSSLGAFFPVNLGPSTYPPFAPSVTLPYIINAQDVQVLISDYSINSFGWAMFVEGKLNETITASMVPSAEQKYFNTDAYRFLLPRLYSAFPDTDLQLLIAPDVWPTIDVSGSGLSLEYMLPLTWQAVFPNGTVDDAFTIGVFLEAAIEPSYNTSANKLQGSLENLVLNLTLLSSEIGDFSVSLLSDLASGAVKTVIIPRIQSELTAGFPLPTLPDGIEVVSPTIIVTDGYIALGLDITFQSADPVQDQTKEKINTI